MWTLLSKSRKKHALQLPLKRSRPIHVFSSDELLKLSQLSKLNVKLTDSGTGELPNISDPGCSLSLRFSRL
jgi:hypothetical protein